MVDVVFEPYEEIMFGLRGLLIALKIMSFLSVKTSEALFVILQPEGCHQRK